MHPGTLCVYAPNKRGRYVIGTKKSPIPGGKDTQQSIKAHLTVDTDFASLHERGDSVV